MKDHTKVCLYCERSVAVVPLLVLQYQEDTLYICPQHLPVLIHKPEMLADKLPGAVNLSPAEEPHHD